VSIISPTPREEAPHGGKLGESTTRRTIAGGNLVDRPFFVWRLPVLPIAGFVSAWAMLAIVGDVGDRWRSLNLIFWEADDRGGNLGRSKFF
jgi:hypothetical protein